MTDERVLKPCPFCGEIPEKMDRIYGDIGNTWRHSWKGCLLDGRLLFEETLLSWNRRVDLAASEVSVDLQKDPQKSDELVEQLTKKSKRLDQLLTKFTPVKNHHRGSEHEFTVFTVSISGSNDKSIEERLDEEASLTRQYW